MELACVKCKTPAYTIYQGNALCKVHFESISLMPIKSSQDKAIDDVVKKYWKVKMDNQTSKRNGRI